MKRKDEDRKEEEEMKDKKEKVSAIADNYFSFLFKYTHHALPHFFFIILQMKGMHLTKQKEEDRKDKEDTKEEKEDDTKEDDMKEKETKEKVSAMGGGNYFFFLFNYTHHDLPHFLFIITKGMHLPFVAKGQPIQIGEMKECNYFFSFYSIFKYLPCNSPISFLAILKMKGLNLPFAAIHPRQIREM